MCIILSFPVEIDDDADHALLYCVRDVHLRTHPMLNELIRRCIVIYYYTAEHLKDVQTIIVLYIVCKMQVR